jgi:hypothetical protein
MDKVPKPPKDFTRIKSRIVSEFLGFAITRAWIYICMILSFGVFFALGVKPSETINGAGWWIGITILFISLPHIIFRVMFRYRDVPQGFTEEQFRECLKIENNPATKNVRGKSLSRKESFFLIVPLLILGILDVLNWYMIYPSIMYGMFWYIVWTICKYKGVFKKKILFDYRKVLVAFLPLVIFVIVIVVFVGFSLINQPSGILEMIGIIVVCYFMYYRSVKYHFHNTLESNASSVRDAIIEARHGKNYKRWIFAFVVFSLGMLPIMILFGTNALLFAPIYIGILFYLGKKAGGKFRLKITL